jgi:hypothetical protein
MSSSFWVLGVESHVLFSQAEKIHKMTTNFTQNDNYDNLGPLRVEIVVIL